MKFQASPYFAPKHLGLMTQMRFRLKQLRKQLGQVMLKEDKFTPLQSVSN